ncbi:hypothetical protein PPOLYM_02517 [Paenibacillus polymyxa]|uniref:DUF6199 family natural product biosynthesis protein n=1 Tax=Paenibacillus polymyxa TaxID=1406 RepID=UPI0009472F81|nr:DUF6199 family natural product biosynthesis protein [Paenibacillus polymyxa]APQ59852.1 hypothetical protein VK72_14610 [Paenibacillus polymyxa]VUG06124.1 hypothetical protein PPOLYM_02517 [Paenibacillus polymyxa]
MGFMFIVMAIIFIGLGILNRRNPTWGWSMNEAWKVKDDSEPSYAYIETIKFTGFIAILIGSFFLACGLLVIFL